MNQTIEDIETKETAQAARINQKHGFSEIVGECHGKNVHYIAECMTGGPGPFRLKTVSYQYFRSEEDLLSACAKHKIVLKEMEGTSQSESFKWWPMRRHNAKPGVTEVTEAKEPEKTFPVENGTMAILCAGALLFVLLYYFKIYKPSHEEEDEDEGIETGDGFPTERDD